MPPANKALWYNQPKWTAMEIREAPYTAPKKNELVIRNHAVAVNPIDLMVASPMSKNAFGWVKYPTITGNDLAGEVVEVGPDVTRFKKGDRVVAEAIGLHKLRNTAAEGAFQEYVVVLENMAAPIPSELKYVDACVIPLAVATAAGGLFQKDYLGLQHPQYPRAKATGKVILIWGGSTSVGANAIQLATAAGYEVFTTASPKNHSFVKSLGAQRAFDYKSPTVVRDIIAALKGKTHAGALAIGYGSASACFDIIGKTQGRKFVATASMDVPDEAGTLGMIKSYMSSEASKWLKSKRSGLDYKFIWASDMAFNEVGQAVWEGFLTKALADGSYVCAPESEVYGHGLEAIEGAMKKWKEGVSAKKIVVSL